MNLLARPLAGLAPLLVLAALPAFVSCTGSTDKLNHDTNTPAACTGPVANAGVSGTGSKGVKYTLDGSASTVCDGSTPTYSWDVMSAPTDSNITSSSLSIINPAQPSFTPDAVGSYVFSLTVSDASGNVSAASLVVVTVSSTSAKPIANCGGDQSADVSARVDLDGSASSDPEGAALKYAWTLSSTPDGDTMGSSDVYNASSAHASFVPDMAGVYIVALAVSDGESWSDPAYCSIKVGSGNLPPVADAGTSKALSPCTEHHYALDGYGSYDPEGAPITYAWTVVSVPAGSTSSQSSFNDATLPNPTFAWDIPGDYTFELQVNDGTQVSAPDVVVLTFHDVADNSPPIANAGSDQTISHDPDCTTASYTFTCDDCPSDDATLDGTASDDPVDGDTLQFDWTESTGTLAIESPNSAKTRVIAPSFPAERNVAETKSWTVGLAVSDCADTTTDSVTVTYTCTGTYSP